MLADLPPDAVERKAAHVVVREDDHKVSPVVLKCDLVALERDCAEQVGLVLLVSLGHGETRLCGASFAPSRPQRNPRLVQSNVPSSARRDQIPKAQMDPTRARF